MLGKRLCILILAGASAAVVGCSHDIDGELVTPTVVAGLRYVNLVPDTGGLDIRVIDIVGDAPNTFNATFRTGGQPYGVAITDLPPHTAVLAGTRQIRAFNSSADPAVASQILLDQTVTFEANQNYTVYLWGNARGGATPLSAMVVKDSVPTLTAGQFALRVINLAPTLAGNPAGSAATAVDIRTGAFNAPTPVAAAAFTNVAPGAMSPYVVMDTAPAAATPYRLYATAAGAAAGSPAVAQAVIPQGARATATDNPVAGGYVGNSALTAIIAPQSVPGSTAPQSTPTAVTTNIDSITRSNDTVTVWRRITPATASACAAPVAAGAAAQNNVVLSGLTQPEYNGSHLVISTTAGAVPTLFSQKTVTLAGGAGAFTLSFGGQTTAVLPFDATASGVQTALRALSSVGTNNVSVSGPTGGPFNVIFMGTFSGTAVGATSLSASASGGLTATVATPAVGCAVNPLRTIDTVTITGAVATDSFRITVGTGSGAQSTPFLSASATTADVQTAVRALSNVGPGVGNPVVPNAVVTGAPGAYIVQFQGQLNNQNVPASASMKAGSTGTVAVGQAAFAFTGAATSSRYRFRITGAPASPATGTPSFKVVTAATDFTIPQVLFIVDQRPPRTLP